MLLAVWSFLLMVPQFFLLSVYGVPIYFLLSALPVFSGFHCQSLTTHIIKFQSKTKGSSLPRDGGLVGWTVVKSAACTILRSRIQIPEHRQQAGILETHLVPALSQHHPGSAPHITENKGIVLLL